MQVCVLLINISCIKVLALMECRLVTSKTLEGTMCYGSTNTVVQKRPVFWGKLTCEFLREANVLICGNREVFIDPCIFLYPTAKTFIIHYFFLESRREKGVGGEGEREMVF